MSKWKCSEENKKFNKFFDILNLAIVIIITLVTIKFWSILPGKIPSHYGLNGNVDAYGSKNTVFIIIPFMIGLYLLFRFAANRPYIGNYTVKITPLNRDNQYNLVSKFLRVFCFEMLILFTYVQFNIIYSTVTKNGHISLIFIPFILFILILSTVIYVKKSKALK